MNKKLDNYLKFLKERYDFEIKNECKDETILFNVSYNQPFKYDIQLLFNGIKDKESFYLNIPALSLKNYDIDGFYLELEKARVIANTLNSLL